VESVRRGMGERRCRRWLHQVGRVLIWLGGFSAGVGVSFRSVAMVVVGFLVTAWSMGALAADDERAEADR
jgi:hypothetical protein